MSISLAPIVNTALAGAMAGYQSSRQPVIDAAGVAVEPADFVVPVEAASNYSVNQQAALYTAPLPTVVPALVNDLSSGGVTVVPSTPVEACGAQSVPVAMAVLSASIFDARTIPLNAAGDPEHAQFFATISNSVAALFQNAVSEMQAS